MILRELDRGDRAPRFDVTPDFSGRGLADQGQHRLQHPAEGHEKEAPIRRQHDRSLGEVGLQLDIG